MSVPPKATFPAKFSQSRLYPRVISAREGRLVLPRSGRPALGVWFGYLSGTLRASAVARLGISRQLTRQTKNFVQKQAALGFFSLVRE